MGSANLYLMQEDLSSLRANPQANLIVQVIGLKEASKHLIHVPSEHSMS